MYQAIKTIIPFFIPCLTSSCLLCHEGQCPSTKPIPEFYSTEATPKVLLNNGVVSFQNPSILKKHPQYVLNQIYVFDENENTILWMIQSQNTCNSETRGDIEKAAKYSPNIPIVYGVTLAGTQEIISPVELKTEVVYSMRADFTGFDSNYHPYPPTPVKASFKLTRLSNNQLTVLALPAKTDYFRIPFLNKPSCNFSLKK